MGVRSERTPPSPCSEAAGGRQASTLQSELLSPLLQRLRQVGADFSEPEVWLHFHDVSPGAACRPPEDQVIPAETRQCSTPLPENSVLPSRRARPSSGAGSASAGGFHGNPGVSQQAPSCQFLPHESHSKGFCLFPLDKTD